MANSSPHQPRDMAVIESLSASFILHDQQVIAYAMIYADLKGCWEDLMS